MYNDNFIGVYENVYDSGFCKHIVDNFDEQVSIHNVGSDRRWDAKPHVKDDYAHFNHVYNIFPDYLGGHVNNIFYDGLQRCFEQYSDKYSILANGHNILGNHIKIQRSLPGQGYHTWHFEQGSGITASRVLVFILYLNTMEVENAGETEFLYLQKRIRPVENTMIIFPAGFTHTHRGNPVHGDKAKYIITGWFSFV